MTEPRASGTAVACPRCGGRAVPVLHGLPSLEAFEATDRGEILLVGCLVTDDDPDFACTGFDCGLRFGSA
jgi:hypothetical protein